MTLQAPIARLSPHPTRQRLGVAAGVALLCSVAVAACGSATSSSSSSSGAAGTATVSAPASTATATPASGTSTVSCPSASAVGAALGITVPAPTVYGASAAGVSCNYLSGSADVILSIVHGIPTGYLAEAEATMQASSASLGLGFTPLSGVGDQAYTYSYTLSTETALGIMAVKGTTYVGIACTGTTTSLSKVETYASQLLG